MEGSEVKYLIISNESMAPVFEELADWKVRKGVPAVVRTVEWITQNYRSGADLAESVRNFIQEAYAKWGVEWVVLGGDTDVIPARLGYVTFHTGELIPTDMYYSCLDGTWNADGDSLWGEAYHDVTDPGDEADLYSEVYVGRMPVSTYAEAEILVNKVISYATPVDTMSKQKFLILAEVIFPTDYEFGDTITLDGAEMTQNIYEPYLEGNPDVTTSRMYETYYLYPGSVCLTKPAALDSLDSGMNHVIHTGHGMKYNMSVATGSIVNYEVGNLTNGDKLYTMYLLNCTNAAFDVECLAEHFLLNPNGGAFAVTGASRSAFPYASGLYMNYYYNLLFEHDIVQLGKLQTKSREPYTPGATSESMDRWTHFIYNYLGDPELNIFQGQARAFTVTMPDSVECGENEITIEVSSGGMPYDSAMVCLYKEGDDYRYDATDAGGSVVFDDVLCRSEGWIYVTVTGINHCRNMDSIRVVEEAGPYLRISDRIIDDYIDGNNDGVLDAGEWVRLRIELENTGQGSGEKLYAVLKSSEASVEIKDSVGVYPDLEPDEKETGLDHFQFEVDAAVVDEEVIEFVLEIHDSTGGLWSEAFAYEVHAPELELFVNVMSDTLPYGNNNGVIESGEDFLLKIGVKNFGTGAAYGLEGELSSTDMNITITDSVSLYDEIVLLGVEYGDGFVLSETDMGVNNYLTFELTDAYGRMVSKQIELRCPDAPVGVLLDASYGPTEIHVTWHPPDEDEDYRYLVYHSTVPGGPYERVSPDLLLHALFRDYGLDFSTVYYYIVTAVDSCGNEGPPSSEKYITTSPPQLAGWPNAMKQESSSGPKAGDIDGDTHLEVVVGSNFVHAWHEDGIEVRDGDNQPVTWGILNTEGDGFTATVALADLDGNPGAEIVGASWNTKEIYVFDHDGNTLPGWPIYTQYVCWASPVVGDIDDDGDLEIIAQNVDTILFALHHDGTEVIDGDNNPATNGVFHVTGSHGIWNVSTPALADMDEDGVVEIICCAPSDSIYCLNGNGTAVPGWPVPVLDGGSHFPGSPAVGDIDNDGHLEMIVQCSSGRIYALNHDGTVMSGWESKWVYSNRTFAGSIALADLTGDGYLEIVIPGMNSNCYIYRYNATTLPNWPQPYASEGSTESSPVIADLDNDGSLDIMIGSEEGRLSAWNLSGEYIPGFPIQLNGFVRGTPVVTDLDYDGDVELIATCWDKNVYVWDLEAGHYYGYDPWPTFHGNNYNTGWYEHVLATSAEEISCVHRFTGGVVELAWRVIPGVVSWDLYRQEGDGAFELLFGELRADEADCIDIVDRSVEEGASYRYRLEAAARPDLSMTTEEIQVPIGQVRLYQNYPNPFNPGTKISFTIPGGKNAREHVLLVVYDARGARVTTLVNEVLPGGRYSVEWNGGNHRGEQVASGIYFAKLSAKGVEISRKLVLIR
jgi:hypothetical protein